MALSSPVHAETLLVLFQIPAARSFPSPQTLLAMETRLRPHRRAAAVSVPIPVPVPIIARVRSDFLVEAVLGLDFDLADLTHAATFAGPGFPLGKWS